jgi:hypothetical protein
MRIVKAVKKQISILDRIIMLSEIRSHLSNDSIAKKICDENSVSEKFLLGVPISFEPIDVSAKTIDGHIILNESLTRKGFDIRMRYVIHELVHAIQHSKDTSSEKNKEDESTDYLDKETEVDAFRWQVLYDSKNRGEKAAEKYVEDLMDHHDLQGKKRDDKKEELMEDL